MAWHARLGANILQEQPAGAPQHPGLARPHMLRSPLRVLADHRTGARPRSQQQLREHQVSPARSNVPGQGSGVGLGGDPLLFHGKRAPSTEPRPRPSTQISRTPCPTMIETSARPSTPRSSEHSWPLFRQAPMLPERRPDSLAPPPVPSPYGSPATGRASGRFRENRTKGRQPANVPNREHRQPGTV
jgi:hypothetical protein